MLTVRGLKVIKTMLIITPGEGGGEIAISCRSRKWANQQILEAGLQQRAIISLLLTWCKTRASFVSALRISHITPHIYQQDKNNTISPVLKYRVPQKNPNPDKLANDFQWKILHLSFPCWPHLPVRVMSGSGVCTIGYIQNHSPGEAPTWSAWSQPCCVKVDTHTHARTHARTHAHTHTHTHTHTQV